MPYCWTLHYSSTESVSQILTHILLCHTAEHTTKATINMSYWPWCLSCAILLNTPLKQQSKCLTDLDTSPMPYCWTHHSNNNQSVLLILTLLLRHAAELTTQTTIKVSYWSWHFSYAMLLNSPLKQQSKCLTDLDTSPLPYCWTHQTTIKVSHWSWHLFDATLMNTPLKQQPKCLTDLGTSPVPYCWTHCSNNNQSVLLILTPLLCHATEHSH